MSPRAAARAFPRPEQVRELPMQIARNVPQEWKDRNGHVGVQYFQALFAEGAWRVLEEIGVDAAWFEQTRRSQFDLEHHLFYRSEVHAGDRVSTYNRILGRSNRRFHGIYFVVNDSSDRLAATLEYITAGIDMTHRRMAPFPEDLARGLDELIEKHRALGWAPLLSGVMMP
ncbi:MAG: thioesterase [Xanthomonadales bacterium]|nr:thioesterase [Xanthomonadales bacterium]